MKKNKRYFALVMLLVVSFIGCNKDSIINLEPVANISFDLVGMNTKTFPAEFNGIVSIYKDDVVIKTQSIHFAIEEDRYMAQGLLEVPLNTPITLGIRIELPNSLWYGISDVVTISGGQSPTPVTIALSGGEGIDFPIVQTTSVVSTSVTHAHIEGEVISNEGSELVRRGIIWSQSIAPTLANNEGQTEEENELGMFISKIDSLSHSTTYYARAYAQNDTGTGYGVVVKFETYPTSGTFVDERDLNEYRFIAIGNQLWMAENLKFLPDIFDNQDTSKTDPRYYVFDYGYDYGYTDLNVDEAKTLESYQTYGVLYNWVAASESCPTGWHLSAPEELDELIDFLGGIDVAGGKMKSTTNHWDDPNEGATNESGFSALPGGRFLGNDYEYYGQGWSGYWWLNILPQGNVPNHFVLESFSTYIGYYSEEPHNGLSARCIKD